MASAGATRCAGRITLSTRGKKLGRDSYAGKETIRLSRKARILLRS